MIRVVVEVSKGVARHRLVVQAQSIQGALSLAEEHCLGDCEIRVVFPIADDTFFVRNTNVAVGLVETEALEDAPAPLTQDHTGQRLDGRGSPRTDLTASSRENGEVLATNKETSSASEDTGEAVKDP